MSTRTQIRLVVSAAAIAVICIVALVAFSGGSSDPKHAGRAPHTAKAATVGADGQDPTTPRSRTVTSKPAKSRPKGKPVALNVYAGGGNAGGAHRADAFLGGAVTGAFDYVPYTSWTALSQPRWLTDAWAGQGFEMTLAVPMFPIHGANLGTCATGAYNGYFTTLAHTLISGGLADSTLVVGWEPETGQYQWSVKTNREAREYAGCWRRIHDALSAVAGARFTFMWDAGDPAPGRVPVSRLYPGDRYVNVISTSAVDSPIGHVPAADQWPAQAHWHYGADWAARFAHAHHKQVAVFMLGLGHMYHDNGIYVAQVLRWATLHHARSVTLWDYRSEALLDGGFPAVVQALRSAHAAGEIRTDGGQAST